LIVWFAGVGGLSTPPGRLQFVPLIAVAPDEPAQFRTAPPACSTPVPVRTFAFFHCYTPADIKTAYGVDKFHAEGTTGGGKRL